MMLRSFIAIEMPAEIQSAIVHSTTSLRNASPKSLVRWVASQNIHLTLKFLGDVSPGQLEKMAQALRAEAACHPTFSMSVGGIGAFPNPRRARIIWIGLDHPPALEALQRGVEAAAKQLGYSPEERPFSPHLTIGRVNQTALNADLQHLRTCLEATQVGILGTFLVDAVYIFKSDLRPGGSVYTNLYALPLKSVP